MDYRHVQYAISKHFLCHIIGLHVSKVCGKRFCQYFVFYPFWPQFLSILLAITRDSVDIQMSTIPHFKAYVMRFLQVLMSSRPKIDIASATG